MLNKTIKSLMIAAALQVANLSWATTVDSEGANSSGLNDQVTTAQNAGAVSALNPLTISGWVDVNNPNDVDFYQFAVSDPSLTLFFDIDLADDFNSANDDDLGLDTALWVFDKDGVLIAWNDNSDFFLTDPDPGSDPFGGNDSFIGGLLLSNGTYFAAVSYWENEANEWGNLNPFTDFSPLSSSGDAISNATPDASFENNVACVFPNLDRCKGQYQLEIRTSFDASNSNQIPEPVSFALIGIGLLSLYVRRRSFRNGA